MNGKTTQQNKSLTNQQKNDQASVQDPEYADNDQLSDLYKIYISQVKSQARISIKQKKQKLRNSSKRDMMLL